MLRWRLGLMGVMLMASGCGDDGDSSDGGETGGGRTTTEATSTQGTETSAGPTSDGTAGGSSTTDGSTTDAPTSSAGETTASETTASETTASETTAGEDTGSSTGSIDEQTLCEDTGGTWDENACDHFVCGIPNDCDAIIPGCNCGMGNNFAEGQGCVVDKECPMASPFACGDELTCDAGLEYCQVVVPGLKGAPTTYSCNAMPNACVDDVDCGCLETELGIGLAGTCSEPTPDGLVVQIFAA